MIGTAVLKDGTVYIFDRCGSRLGYITGCDKLQGYTAETVAVWRGSRLELYDANGSYIDYVNV